MTDLVAVLEQLKKERAQLEQGNHASESSDTARQVKAHQDDQAVEKNIQFLIQIHKIDVGTPQPASKVKKIPESCLRALFP